MGIAKGSPCVRCGLPSVEKGLCHEHFKESRRKPGAKFSRRKNPDGTPRQCAWAKCAKPVHADGFCNAHYQANRNGGYVDYPECAVQGCPAPCRSRTWSLCRNHAKVGWRYSLSQGEVIAMYAEYVCSNRACGATADLHIDHDHSCCTTTTYGTSSKMSCGECVRGWLCRACNHALGNTEDDVNRLLGLVDFLERQKSPE